MRRPRASVRRSDGAVVTYATSPYPAMLEGFCAKGEWEPALRLCRYVKQDTMWACLAAMAVAGKELHTAEVAYAAISQVDKGNCTLITRDIDDRPAPGADPSTDFIILAPNALRHPSAWYGDGSGSEWYVELATCAAGAHRWAE